MPGAGHWMHLRLGSWDQQQEVLAHHGLVVHGSMIGVIAVRPIYICIYECIDIYTYLEIYTHTHIYIYIHMVVDGSMIR